MLDLRRVQREGDIDLRGRNLSDADALLIVATLQQRPDEASPLVRVRVRVRVIRVRVS